MIVPKLEYNQNSRFTIPSVTIPSEKKREKKTRLGMLFLVCLANTVILHIKTTSGTRLEPTETPTHFDEGDTSPPVCVKVARFDLVGL